MYNNKSLNIVLYDSTIRFGPIHFSSWDNTILFKHSEFTNVLHSIYLDEKTKMKEHSKEY